MEPPGKEQAVVSALLRQLRPHQWAKNGLLALPALAGHLPWTPTLAWRLALGFLAFSSLASAVYIINDLVDLEADRSHPSKRRRPLAAGEVSPGQGLATAAVCVLVAAGLALVLPVRFAVWLGVYALVTGAYSAWLKRRLLVDVVALASLYTCRIIAGAALAGIGLTRWFLAFSVFVFFSLALAKRVIELHHAGESAGRSTFGRRYDARDMPVLTALGAATSVAASLVYCLYISSDEMAAIYQSPDVLWAGLPLILYWLARVWILAHRGALDDDPVVFALRDRTSYLVAVAFLGTTWLATQPLLARLFS
jgi:4-hydroxybenzoate polyprenyltransferase